MAISSREVATLVAPLNIESLKFTMLSTIFCIILLSWRFPRRRYRLGMTQNSAEFDEGLAKKAGYAKMRTLLCFIAEIV